MIGLLALVAGWSFAEGLLFFLVADVPISWVALNRGWRAGLVAALIAAPAAALGGLAMAQWATTDPDAARAALVALPAIDAALVDRARAEWAAGGYWAMAKGAFAGEPYKLFAQAWALDPRGGTTVFLIGSVLARLPRFVLVALGGALARRLAVAKLGLGRCRLLLIAGWTVFYAWYFWATPS